MGCWWDMERVCDVGDGIDIVVGVDGVVGIEDVDDVGGDNVVVVGVGVVGDDGDVIAFVSVVDVAIV